MHDYFSVIQNVDYIPIEWVEENSQVPVLLIRGLFIFPLLQNNMSLL